MPQAPKTAIFLACAALTALPTVASADSESTKDAAARSDEGAGPAEKQKTNKPPVPVLPDGERVYVAPEVRQGVDYDRLVECTEKLTDRSDVYGNYYAYLFSTDEQPELSKVPSINGYADRVWETWQEDGVVDKQRGVLFVMDIENNSVGVRIGKRWEQADFFDRYAKSPVKFLESDPAKRVCLTAEHVDNMLGRVLEADKVRSRLDVHSRMNLVEERTESALERASNLQARAETLTSSESELTVKVRSTLKTNLLRRLAKRQLEALRRFVDMESKLTRREAMALIRHLDREVDNLRTRNKRAAEYVDDFEFVQRELRDFGNNIEKLHGKIDERAQSDLVWLGADDARGTLAECGSRIETVRGELETGTIVESDITDFIPPCLKKARKQIRAGDPLNIFVVRFLPTLAVVMLLSGAGFMGWRKVKATGERELEAAELVEDWDQDLQMAEMRLRPLRREFRDFLEGGQTPPTLAELSDQQLETLRTAHLLAQNLRERREDARELIDGAGRFGFSSIKRAHGLLTENEVSLKAVGYKNTAAEAIEDLERLVDAARAALD